MHSCKAFVPAAALLILHGNSRKHWRADMPGKDKQFCLPRPCCPTALGWRLSLWPLSMHGQWLFNFSTTVQEERAPELRFSCKLSSFCVCVCPCGINAINTYIRQHTFICLTLHTSCVWMCYELLFIDRVTEIGQARNIYICSSVNAG